MTNALAVEKEMIGVYYVARGGESLDDVLNVFNIPSSIAYGKTQFAEQVKALNMTITKWDHLNRGYNVYLKIPKSFYLRNPPKNIKSLSIQSQVQERMKDTVDHYVVFDKDTSEEEIIKKQNDEGYQVKSQEISKPEEERQTGLERLSLFYMASAGSFQETIPDTTLITKSDQNSPVSLGISWESYFRNIGHIFSGSFYFSKLTPTSTNGQTVNLPLEYGANVYDNFAILQKTLNLYVGLDYEKFATINAEEIANGMEARALDQSIFYGTLGFSKSFKLFIPLFAKISLSKSFFSSGMATAYRTETKYSGQRLVLFLEHKISSDFAVNILFKKHFLKGPTELSVNRLGVGIRYSFF